MGWFLLMGAGSSQNLAPFVSSSRFLGVFLAPDWVAHCLRQCQEYTQKTVTPGSRSVKRLARGREGALSAPRMAPPAPSGSQRWGRRSAAGARGGVYPIETPKVPDLRSWHPGPQLTSRNHARPAPSRQMADSWGTWGLAHSRNLPAGKTRASVQWFPGGKEGSIRLRRT